MVNYRLTETMESRIHRKVYVRFGGEYPETRHRNMKMGVGYLAYMFTRRLCSAPNKAASMSFSVSKAFSKVTEFSGFNSTHSSQAYNINAPSNVKNKYRFFID